MRTGALRWFGMLALAGSLHGQETKLPLAFDTASIKPAPPGAQRSGDGFMLPIPEAIPPRGLLTATIPLNVYIAFAYGIRDEVEIRAFTTRLPEWSRRQLYTVVARPSQASPTVDQLRLMMRSLLEERFALKVHRETHEGPVNRLLLVKDGVTGPGMQPHPADSSCDPPASAEAGKAPEQGKPQPTFCGWLLSRTSEGLLRIRMGGITIAQAGGQFGEVGGMAGGRASDTVVDGTGLRGLWDMTLEFQPEWKPVPGAAPPAENAGGPTFTGALEKQLGLRLQKGTGPVEDLIIDHIAEPTPD